MSTTPNTDSPEPFDVKALGITIDEVVKAIMAISKAMNTLSESRLQYSAIITMLAHQTKLPRSTIRIVLDNMQSLETLFLKK